MASKRDHEQAQKQERERDDAGPVPGLVDLREITPPPAMVASIMRRVADPPPAGFWSWLSRPRRIELRLSPLMAVAAVVLLTSVGLLAVGPLAPDGGSGPRAGMASAASSSSAAAASSSSVSSAGAAAAEKATVLVRFVVEARGAKRVSLAGDFNGWSTEAHVLEDPDSDGLFVATVALPRGDHRYMFVVDGEWRTDPGADARRPDGFGRENAVLHL
jgi:hypothetical protein